MAIVVLSSFAFLGAIMALGRAILDHRFYLKEIDSLSEKVKIVEGQLKKRAQLADEIAHEIKNPLTAILCSAETLDLLVGDKLEDQHRQSLAYIREYGDQLLRLVSDYLDVSRIESQQFKSFPRSVSVGETIRPVLGLLQSKSYASQVKLSYLGDSSDSEAYIDPQHLKQVVFNLVHNALKFTPPGGEVSVCVSSQHSAEHIKITVKDTGQGIRAEELDDIFSPYVHRERGNTVELGTGLGLALCKSLLGLAGGRITVESELGVGTKFEVFVPRSTEVNLKSNNDNRVNDYRSGQRGGETPLLGQSFLVCDADPVTREAIARLIEAWGGMVDRFEESISALKAMSNRDYDAVMVDAGGSIDYLTLLNNIGPELTDHQTKLIFTTTEPVADEIRKQRNAGLLLEKPLNGKLLLHSLLQSNK